MPHQRYMAQFVTDGTVLGDPVLLVADGTVLGDPVLLVTDGTVLGDPVLLVADGTVLGDPVLLVADGWMGRLDDEAGVALVRAVDRVGAGETGEGGKRDGENRSQDEGPDGAGWPRGACVGRVPHALSS
jgi:hypothetical protein